MEPWWQVVAQTAAAEFSDVNDAAQNTRVVLRLSLAAVLGGLLGWERESSGQSAGVRTHMLVAMGAALLVLVALQSGMPPPDASRVIQGIVTGVGFLGAGTILKREPPPEETTASSGTPPAPIQGLTTAAGIWLTAAIGVAAGLGEETTAVLSALIAVGILSLVPWITRSRPRRH